MSALAGTLRPQLVATMSSFPSPSRSPAAMPIQRLVHLLKPHESGAGTKLPLPVQQDENRSPLPREHEIGMPVAVDVGEHRGGNHADVLEHPRVRGVEDVGAANVSIELGRRRQRIPPGKRASADEQVERAVAVVVARRPSDRSTTAATARPSSPPRRRPARRRSPATLRGTSFPSQFDRPSSTLFVPLPAAPRTVVKSAGAMGPCDGFGTRWPCSLWNTPSRPPFPAPTSKSS